MIILQTPPAIVQPQIIKPPYLIVGITHFELYSSPTRLLTKVTTDVPNTCEMFLAYVRIRMITVIIVYSKYFNIGQIFLDVGVVEPSLDIFLLFAES